MSVTLELKEHPTADDLRMIVDGVRAFNREQTGQDRPRQIACVLRDEVGKVVGGVHGNLWGRSVHIDALWVDEPHRGQGHGLKLMQAIEEYAAAHAYPLVYLETTSFQALPFYKGLGYRLWRVRRNQRRSHVVLFTKRFVTLLLECDNLLPRS
jgi:GNAT superfamily N-acetyltransferase